MALQVRTPLGWRSNPASGPPNLVVFQSLLIPAADAAEKTVLACSMPSLNQGERRELGSCPRRGDQRKGRRIQIPQRPFRVFRKRLLEDPFTAGTNPPPSGTFALLVRPPAGSFTGVNLSKATAPPLSATHRRGNCKRFQMMRASIARPAIISVIAHRPPAGVRRRKTTEAAKWIWRLRSLRGAERLLPGLRFRTAGAMGLSPEQAKADGRLWISLLSASEVKQQPR